MKIREKGLFNVPFLQIGNNKRQFFAKELLFISDRNRKTSLKK